MNKECLQENESRGEEKDQDQEGIERRRERERRNLSSFLTVKSN